MNEDDLVRSSIRGVLWTIGIYVSALLLPIFAGSLESDIGFGIALLLLRVVFPFWSIYPEISSPAAWTFQATYFVGATMLIAIASRRSSRLRTGLIAILVVLICGAGLMQLVQAAGHRYVFEGP